MHPPIETIRVNTRITIMESRSKESFNKIQDSDNLSFSLEFFHFHGGRELVCMKNIGWELLEEVC